MRRWIRMLCWMALPTLLACGPAEELKDARARSVRLWHANSRIQLTIEFDNCLESTQLVATLNGEPMNPSSDGSRDDLCFFRVWQLPLPPPTEFARFEIFDESKKVVVEAPNLLAQRQLAVRSPSGGVAHVGEEVVLEWLPSTDQMKQSAVTVMYGSKEAGHGAVASWGFSAYKDNLVRFRVPSSFRQVEAGTGELEMSVWRVQSTFSRCEGVSQCTGEVATRMTASTPFTFSR